MNYELQEKINKKFSQKGRDKFGPGDTVAVHTKIQEGDKTRTQIFEGVVLSIKGNGVQKTFTVRKLSHGVGVEKIFPFESPLLEKVEIVKKSKTRRSKLYYLRNKIGNRALKVKDGAAITEEDRFFEEVVEESKEEVAEDEKDASTEEKPAEEAKEEPKEEAKEEKADSKE